MVTNILSQTSKMPCKSISLDAELCNTGSKLAKIPNTPCNKCYALRGFYNMPSVKKAMAARLEFMTGEYFVERMIHLLANEDYFRWFDSGDVQSYKMANDIVTIADNTPWCTQWCPSKEYYIWRKVLKNRTLPSNLIIRMSTPVDDTEPMKGFIHTSTTYTSPVSKALPFAGVECKAHENEHYECGTCRACWNIEVGNVAYPKRYERKVKNG